MTTNTGPQPFNDLTQHIETEQVTQGRFIGRSAQTDLSVTGQPYVDLVTDTPRLDRGMALIAGLGIFDSYARNRIGSLYWHTKPTIERVRNGRFWGYRVSMRLLISDNPIVPRLAAEAEAAE